jgi:hypothetical protein
MCRTLADGHDALTNSRRRARSQSTRKRGISGDGVWTVGNSSSIAGFPAPSAGPLAALPRNPQATVWHMLCSLIWHRHAHENLPLNRPGRPACDSTGSISGARGHACELRETASSVRVDRGSRRVLLPHDPRAIDAARASHAVVERESTGGNRAGTNRSSRRCSKWISRHHSSRIAASFGARTSLDPLLSSPRLTVAEQS